RRRQEEGDTDAGAGHGAGWHSRASRAAGVARWVKRRDPVRTALLAMTVGWALVFIVLGWRQQDRFATYGFDLGIYDQGIWLLSRFKDPFITVRGLELFGHHMNPALVAFVPFYWLGAGPHFLLVAQVAAQASGAVAVFLLARDRLSARWPAVALGGALLLHPSYQFMAWEYFHPDTLAIAPLLFAYWAARHRRWGWFGLAVVLALACKEDVALAVVVLGLLVAWRGDRRRGLLISAGAAVWYLVSTRLLIPRANGIGPFYESYFGDFGSTTAEVVRNVATHPGRAWSVATRDNRLDYYRMMLAPTAFLAVVGLPGLLVAGPMLAVNALSSFPYLQDIRYHYSALVLVGVLVGTVEAVAYLGRTASMRAFLVGLVMATSLATSVAWGPSPIGTKFRSGIWALQTDGRVAARRAALAVVPAGAAVSATYHLVPHLTHRPKVYEWPVPWRNVNWGVRGEHLDDPAGVSWLVVDLRLQSPEDLALLDGLLGRQFAVRFERDDILAAERVQPPRAANGP
ncbi:MAG: DUF2079 domain-containing protein, partial [Acidimicrobiales bacterium]